MSDNSRLCAVTLIVGAPGAGKTTLVKQIIKEQTKKVLILDVANKDFNEYEIIHDLEKLAFWEKGIKRVMPTDFDMLLDYLFKYAYNVMIVLDDSTAYMPDHIDLRLKNLLVMRRHRNLDFIFLYHGFNMVQPKIYQLSNYLTVFKTPEDENYVKRLNKVPNQNVLLQAVKQIRMLQDSEKKLPKEKQQYRYLNYTIPTLP